MRRTSRPSWPYPQVILTATMRPTARETEMRVTDLRTMIVELPLERPTRNASGVSNDRIGCVLVFIDTDIGVTGESFLFTLGGRRIEVLETMVASLKPAIVGEDIRYAERVWDRLWRELYFLGHKGVTVFGL